MQNKQPAAGNMVKLKRIFTAWIDQTVDCIVAGGGPFLLL